MAILLADSGATKCEWSLLDGKKTKRVFTQGISPYFLSAVQISQLVSNELVPLLGKSEVTEVHYFGTGLAAADNVKILQKSLKAVFTKAKVYADTDMMAAAVALCGSDKGVACNLGTGSFITFYNGKKIVKSVPGIGYALGDEGSGAYLGKKVVQYFLYDTFDEELKFKFDQKYSTNRAEILENVYKKPLPNRYLAGFAVFLAENRGHYMIENILEDGLNDFFFQHLCKFNESWKHPIHFVGGIAYGFSDVIKELCRSYEFELGKILKNPMEGLIEYYRKER